MCQLVIVEELDGLAQLEGHVAHLVDGVGQVVVVFEEIEGAKAQKLKGDTHVAMVVKPVKHLDTEVLVVRVLLIDFLQDVDFKSSCFLVLFHILNDLQGNSSPAPAMVDTLYNSAKGPLSQGAYNFISLL